MCDNKTNSIVHAQHAPVEQVAEFKRQQRGS